VKIEFICDKCGETQKRDESMSNANWDVMPVVPCKCGGKFVPTVVAPKRKQPK
jgi:hypothetical protein